MILAGLMVLRDAGPEVNQEGYPKDGFRQTRTSYWRPDAEREARILLKELQSRSTMLKVFFSYWPEDWMMEPKFLPDVLKEDSRDEAFQYWKSKSMFVYVSSPIVNNRKWEDIPDNAPVLTGSRRDNYEVIVVLTKSGKNLMAVEPATDQSNSSENR